MSDAIQKSRATRARVRRKPAEGPGARPSPPPGQAEQAAAAQGAGGGGGGGASGGVAGEAGGPRISVEPVLGPASPPQTPEALHALLTQGLGVAVPRCPLVPASSAPFDYLCHTIFEGRLPGAGEEASGRSADCVVWASRGGGKTFLGAVATMLDMVFKPGIEVRILGGSLEQSSRMFAHLRRLFEHPRLAGLVEGKPTERQIRLSSGSRVQVLAQSETAVRGTRVQKLRCDEVDLFDKAIWEAAQLTTRSLRLPGPWGPWVRGSVEALSTLHRPMGIMFELVGGAGGIEAAVRGDATAGATPAGPRHGRGPRALFRWGVVDVLEVCEAERACEPCPLLPECAGRAKSRGTGGAGGHVSIDDAIDMKRRVSAASWACEMLALRPRLDDAVFGEFEPSRHIVSWGEPRRVGQTPGVGPDALVPVRSAHRSAAQARLVAGMDFGYRGLTVVLWGVVDAAGVLTIVDERSVAHQRLEQHIDAILESPWGVPDWIGVDPAGRQANMQTGRSNIQMMRARGLKVRWRAAGVATGIAMVRARLDPAAARAEPPVVPVPGAVPLTISVPPRLVIDPRCGALIDSLQRHHYDPERPDRFDPVKDGSDHAADALRYLVVNLDQPHRTARHWAGGVWQAPER